MCTDCQTLVARADVTFSKDRRTGEQIVPKVKQALGALKATFHLSVLRYYRDGETAYGFAICPVGSALGFVLQPLEILTASGKLFLGPQIYSGLTILSHDWEPPRPLGFGSMGQTHEQIIEDCKRLEIALNTAFNA